MKSRSNVASTPSALVALKRQFTIVAVTMGVGLLVADLLCSAIVWSEYSHVEALKARGVDTTGTVVETYVASRGGPHARYTYTLPSGAIVRASGAISARDAAVLKPGMKVPVAYDLKQPRTSDIDLNGEVRKRNVGPLLWMLGLANLVFIGVGAGMAWFLRGAYFEGKTRLADEADAVQQVTARVASMGGPRVRTA